MEARGRSGLYDAFKAHCLSYGHPIVMILTVLFMLSVRLVYSRQSRDEDNPQILIPAAK